jgi:fused signal recognition particle receptor
MQSDPFEYLANAGNHENTWLLIGGPALVFAVVAILLVLFIRLRRSREDRQFSSEYKASMSRSSPPAAKTSEKSVQDETTTQSEDISALKSESRDAWLVRLRDGLSRTRQALSGGLTGIFAAGARIDDDTLEKVHEVLYRADVGVKTADRLVAGVRSRLAGQVATWSDVKQSMAVIGQAIFSEALRPINCPDKGPFVLLIVGVNGVGKTTTIGKLAARFIADGKKVMLCAADTFRAAAIEQLMVWGERNGVPVIKQHQGADPAAVAFDGVQAAKSRGMDVLIIDTAGRLHNKNDLMSELSKINKSIAKAYDGAPHETWIVVDATTGQNAVQQVKSFSEVTPVSGIVVTKLDGTAKGGVIVGIADQFKIPIRYIGVGEKVNDLRAFEGPDFMQGLLDG